MLTRFHLEELPFYLDTSFYSANFPATRVFRIYSLAAVSILHTLEYSLQLRQLLTYHPGQTLFVASD